MVAVSSRDQVNMAVKNGLAGDSSGVCAGIEAGDCGVLPQQLRPGFS
jgi:hypothetical protein